jgi:hypothetical protein
MHVPIGTNCIGMVIVCVTPAVDVTQPNCAAHRAIACGISEKE